ncbi:MAG: SDR family oxidoreductase [Burkholderiales bacterium]|nr:SDR family oxidoreductase [Burkholderiales bacterium]
MAPTLAGRVALVTGAGRGIGRAVALAYAQAGAAVACVARSGGEVAAVAQAITAAGGRAIALAGDATDAALMAAHVRATEAEFGGLDIVFGAAGASLENKPVAESDPTLWRRTVEVNLFGTFVTAHAALPALRRRGGGKLIFVGSGMGHRGAATRSAYASSKAGLNMLVRVLAQELAGEDITVNELVPGPVLTAFISGRVDALRGAVGGQEWFKEPEDVVPLALFMATQPPRGPTGQTFSLARRDL